MRAFYEGLLVNVAHPETGSWSAYITAVSKRSPKSLQAEHPLQCRGLKDKLTIEVTERVLAAFLNGAAVVEVPLHKIVTFAVAGRTAYIVARRGQKFVCHLFRFSTVAKATKFVDHFSNQTSKQEPVRRAQSMFLPAPVTAWPEFEGLSEREYLQDSDDHEAVPAPKGHTRSKSLPLMSPFVLEQTKPTSSAFSLDNLDSLGAESDVDNLESDDEDAEQDDDLPNVEDDTCLLCGLGPDVSDPFVYARLCDHCFHEECWSKWTHSHNLCPECDCSTGQLYLMLNFVQQTPITNLDKTALVHMATTICDTRTPRFPARVRAVKGKTVRYESLDGSFSTVRAARPDVKGVFSVDDIVCIVDQEMLTDNLRLHVFQAATRSEAQHVASSIHAAQGPLPYELFFHETTVVVDE